MGSVVRLDQHRKTKDHQIQAQEKKAQAALMAASVEFRRLAEMRGDCR